jgi:crossover junction endodeoxyribonuclease RuvC
MKSIGIDPSITATGVVVLQAGPDKVPLVRLEHSIKNVKGEGLQRTQSIVLELMEIIHEHKPDRVVIEGYSLNLKNASSVVPLVELGGLLRFMLMLDELPWLAPRAGELKKFVTGGGNAKKDEMMMWVLKRWGHTSKSNDTALQSAGRSD